MRDIDRVLVVEDEETLRTVIETILREDDLEVLGVGSAEEGLAILQGSTIAVALLDIVLPGMNGIEMLGRIRDTSPDTQVLIMTSHASVETAVEANRRGAYDYLMKPFEDIEEVRHRVRRALETRSLSLKNRNLLREQEKRNRELSAAIMRLSSLIDAGRALGEFHSLTELLDSFLGLVSKELRVDRASLMLLDERGEALRVVASKGIFGTDVTKIRVPLGEGIAGQVAKTGQPMLVKDLDSDPRVQKSLIPNLADSFICAPIILSIPIKFQGKVLGVISVTNRQAGEPFGPEDLNYLSSMSGQLAVAIERTRHFEDLQKAYEELKATQDKLVMTERVKAIGQMAAGVAHDFNNILSIILGKAQLLQMRVGNEGTSVDEIRSDLEMIVKLSLQGAETIKRVQNYTRFKGNLPDKPIDINSVIREAVQMTQPKWKAQCEAEGRDITIQYELGSIPMVGGNGHELLQLISNLIFNAVEAMPGGGQLTFKTFRDKEWVVLEVVDTGTGMNEEVQEHLFEPFFTTKETGQGLGTSIVYAIIARHRGEITVRSRENEGTAFRVKLRRYRSKAQVPDNRTKEREAGCRSARVLYVEDEEAARNTYQEVLSACGHEVITAPNGKEAMSLFGKGRFDLVITDLSMPGMSGVELVKGVKRVDPGIPVVLLSGWSLEEMEEELKETGVDQVLAKPCPKERLMDAVERVLASDRRTNERDESMSWYEPDPRD